eukprot:CAMPEP_0168624368 /NCGR_PEP_ID=MMETSP0449_2-20121227/9361_1 /TAXON_ID=1082188 /ORGANISM="Strombidium rassoulzadegani, Strain ras09" /LENGTH=54 /DNA_ID=CAMNT_0008665891 /DNA_START=408 /DNA_END=572 /DNA_ORIENTATION=-
MEAEQAMEFDFLKQEDDQRIEEILEQIAEEKRQREEENRIRREKRKIELRHKAA